MGSVIVGTSFIWGEGKIRSDIAVDMVVVIIVVNIADVST
jgi:hypothetical protein